jgi:hypothetical protein
MTAFRQAGCHEKGVGTWRRVQRRAKREVEEAFREAARFGGRIRLTESIVETRLSAWGVLRSLPLTVVRTQLF